MIRRISISTKASHVLLEKGKSYLIIARIDMGGKTFLLTFRMSLSDEKRMHWYDYLVRENQHYSK